MRRSKRNARSALLFLLGLVVAGLVAELFFRIVEATPLWRLGPVVEISPYGPDPATGYALRPNVVGIWRTENRVRVRISPQGLRDASTPFAKPKNVVRVALMGDSITEALQVELENTYQSIAERILAKRNKSVQVINLAIAGATPAVSLERLRTIGEKFVPDIAVFVHSAGDFASLAMIDDSRFPAYRHSPSDELRLSHGFRRSFGYRLRSSRWGRAIYWLIDRSRVAGALNGRKNVGLLAELQYNPRRRASAGALMPACDRTLLRRRFSIWRKRSAGPAGEVIAAFLRDLAAYRARTRRSVILALFNLAPACALDNPARIALAKAIKLRTAAHGLVFVDVDAVLRALLPANRNIADLKGFGVNRGTSHLNRFGHRIMALALAEMVAKNLPPSN